MTDNYEGRIWFGVAQAADYSGYCTRTVADALRSGELEGKQRVKGGRWRIHRTAIDTWLGGPS